MTGAALPLVSNATLDDVIAWRPEGPVRVRTFLGDARRVARALPLSAWVVNLCDDRYHFAVVFAPWLGCPGGSNCLSCEGSVTWCLP